MLSTKYIVLRRETVVTMTRAKRGLEVRHQDQGQRVWVDSTEKPDMNNRQRGSGSSLPAREIEPARPDPG